MQDRTRLTRKQASASLDLYRPPAGLKLSHNDAIQLLALLRALSHKYGVGITWGRSFDRAFNGRPALAKPDEVLPETAAIGCAAGEAIVENPGEGIRGLLIGIERGMHNAGATE